jgi:hypothetical protein
MRRALAPRHLPDNRVASPGSRAHLVKTFFVSPARQTS